MPRLEIDIPDEIYNQWLKYFIPSNKVILATHLIIEKGVIVTEEERSDNGKTDI